MVTRQVLRVILASPGDVQEARDRVAKVIEEVNTLMAHDAGLDLELGRWETDAFPGFHVDGPQGLIDEVLKIEDSSVVIGIFWKRFGTPVPDAGSGSEHEILRAHESWKANKRPEIMLYFKVAAFYPESERELDQMASVMKFRERFKSEAIYFSFETTDEFEGLLRRQLTAVVRRLAIPQTQPSKVDQVEAALADVQSVVPASKPRPRRRFPRYLEHDNVLWADDGQNYFGGGAMASGPMCPTDRATLRFHRSGSRDTEKVKHDGQSVGPSAAALTCPECRTNYYLTSNNFSKDVGVSREEVIARFEGLRRQDH